MSAQDKLEKVLRDMHMLMSKSDPAPGAPGSIIVNKEQMLNLLSELNTSIYGMMDEYELTARSRDKAEREFRKKGDEIIWDASRKAEDVYAASVMYTEEALNSIQEIMSEATEAVKNIYTEMNQKFSEEQKAVAHNQSELKAQLRDLRDTEKYLRLIEDRNEEILKEKRKEGKAPKQEASLYANRQTEVKVNKAVLEQLGIESELPEEAAPKAAVEEKLPEISDEDLMMLSEDDIYEGKETFSNLEEAMASKEKESDGFGKLFKGLTGSRDKK